MGRGSDSETSSSQNESRLRRSPRADGGGAGVVSVFAELADVVAVGAVGLRRLLLVVAAEVFTVAAAGAEELAKDAARLPRFLLELPPSSSPTLVLKLVVDAAAVEVVVLDDKLRPVVVPILEPIPFDVVLDEAIDEVPLFL